MHDNVSGRISLQNKSNFESNTWPQCIFSFIHSTRTPWILYTWTNHRKEGISSFKLYCLFKLSDMLPFRSGIIKKKNFLNDISLGTGGIQDHNSISANSFGFSTFFIFLCYVFSYKISRVNPFCTGSDSSKIADRCEFVVNFQKTQKFFFISLMIY